MKHLSLAFIISLFAFSANAGIYLEPYLGYETGSFEGDLGASNMADFDLTGITIGGKIGYSTLGFAVGLDYATGSPDLEVSGVDFSSDTTDIGIFAQFTLPVLFKLSATYFLSSTLEMEGGSEYEGSGFKIGAGFTGLPFVSINLDMIAINYDEVESIAADMDRETWLLSVSLPLSL